MHAECEYSFAENQVSLFCGNVHSSALSDVSCFNQSIHFYPLKCQLICPWLLKYSHGSFTKNTFSSCAAKAKESQGVEWRTRVGVVINTGQGRVRVGKWLHARAGNTGEQNTRDKRNTTLASRCLSCQSDKGIDAPPTFLSANNPPLGSLSVRLVQINIRVTVGRTQRHTASPEIWKSDFKVVLHKN